MNRKDEVSKNQIFLNQEDALSNYFNKRSQIILLGQAEINKKRLNPGEEEFYQYNNGLARKFASEIPQSNIYTFSGPINIGAELPFIPKGFDYELYPNGLIKKILYEGKTENPSWGLCHFKPSI